jgi:hypothetical protein
MREQSCPPGSAARGISMSTSEGMRAAASRARAGSSRPALAIEQVEHAMSSRPRGQPDSGSRRCVHRLRPPGGHRDSVPQRRIIAFSFPDQFGVQVIWYARASSAVTTTYVSMMLAIAPLGAEQVDEQRAGDQSDPAAPRAGTRR